MTLLQGTARSNVMTDAELTAIYNEANGVGEGKRPPLTTEKVFAAMRLVAAKERERCAQVCENQPPNKGIIALAEAERCAEKIRNLT
jgi:hypothetical protein